MKLVYSDDILTAEVDEEKSLLRVFWLRHPKSEEFMERFSYLVNLAIENNYTYWLSDSRAIHYLEFSVQNWVMDQILPMLKFKKLKKYARVTTKESMALMDVSRVHKAVETFAKQKELAELELFLSQEDALEWLLEEV